MLAAFEHIHCTDNVNLCFGAFAANVRNDFGIVVRGALNTPNGNVVQSEQNEDLFCPHFLNGVPNIALFSTVKGMHTGIRNRLERMSDTVAAFAEKARISEEFGIFFEHAIVIVFPTDGD